MLNNKKIYIILSTAVLSSIAVCLFWYQKREIYEQQKQINQTQLEKEILQSQLDELITKIDSADIVNETKTESNKNKQVSEDKTEPKTSVTNKNKEIKNFELVAKNVHAKGVKIIIGTPNLSSKKPIEQLRVCFTLEGNEFIPKESKTILIQVVNPKGSIISANNTTVVKNNKTLIYSAEIAPFFNQKDTDVCTYVDLEKYKTIKGNYQINIYNNFKKIGTTTFEYNE